MFRINNLKLVAELLAETAVSNVRATDGSSIRKEDLENIDWDKTSLLPVREDEIGTLNCFYEVALREKTKEAYGRKSS